MTTDQSSRVRPEPGTGAGGAAGNPTPPSAPPALSPVELARWAWRQLTSMRTALVLLFLLALAAVPGSIVPQKNLDAETLKKMFRAQARAVEKIEKDPRPYVHYFLRETGGLLKPEEFQTCRLLHAAPQPYTRERWDDTYRWTVKWNMTVPGATFENTVDNRAWS